MGFPYMDGLDLCRQLREISEVLIIILEDRDKRKDIIPGLEIGADDYMTKSFDQMELITHARSVLRRASVQATSSLQSFSQGRLVINFSVREVRLDGTSST
jgi:two-component system response regulator MtrA